MEMGLFLYNIFCFVFALYTGGFRRGSYSGGLIGLQNILKQRGNNYKKKGLSQGDCFVRNASPVPYTQVST